MQRHKDFLLKEPGLTKASVILIGIANKIWFLGVVSWWGSYFFFLKWYYVIPIIIFSFWDPILIIAPKIYFKLKNVYIDTINQYYVYVLFYVSTVSFFSIFYFLNLLLK
jgi:hypothetical protein